MCCQKAFLKQNDILWDCIATSMKTAQYLVYSQLMESCFNSFVFLSFLPWCTELVRSLLIAHWLHPYPQNSKQGSRAGPLYKLQNSNPISDMTPRRPKGWSSNTSCNSNPKYFGYDTGHLKSSTTRYLNSSTTRNLNLNLNSSTHQESESELFPEQGISVTETNWFPVEGLGLEPEIHSTLCVIVVVVYTNCSRTKKAKNRKEFGL